MQKKIKTIFKVIKTVLIIFLVLILGIICIQRITGNKVNIMGYTMYTVISESMKPEYEVGDLFLSKKVDNMNELKVGDDIVYLGKVGDYANKTITHRIIRMGKEKITTKGINNPIEDASIDFEQVQGKVIRRLPILSLFSKLMNNSVLFYIIVFIPFAILVFLDVKGIIEDKNKLEEEKNKGEIGTNNELITEEKKEIEEEE